MKNTTGIIKSKYMSMKIGVGNPVTCCNKKRSETDCANERENVSEVIYATPFYARGL